MTMGCLCSKEESDPDGTKSRISLGSESWFCKSKDKEMKFHILADCIRARNRSLGRNMVHEYKENNFEVEAKLLTDGDLEVVLMRKVEEEVDMHLKVVLILIDENIEVLDKVVKEDTQEKGAETARVTFPIVTLSDRILPLSFFVVAVSISVGDTVVETNNYFSQSDYNTFFAWRSDKSDW